LIPTLTLTDDHEEMDAQQLVCTYLVRACRQAIYELAIEDEVPPDTRHRAVEVLKAVHQDWLEAQKALAHELRATKETRTSPGVVSVSGRTRVRSGVK
jgi:hypothetical protein